MNQLRQPPPEKREISDLVILEHEDWAEDRLKNSYCILAHSTAHCGQLLEGETEPDGNVYKYADIKSNDQKPVSLIQSDSSYLNVASLSRHWKKFLKFFLVYILFSILLVPIVICSKIMN